MENRLGVEALAALYHGDDRFKQKKYEIKMKNQKFPLAKRSIGEDPKLELKDLSPHLRYEF